MLNLKYRVLELKKLLKMAQVCSKLCSVPVYRGILGQIFFSVIKKNWWHRWHSGQNRLKVLVLANNSCATTSISLGTAWHKWCKYWVFCNYALAHFLLGARDLFCFFKNFFAQKSPYTVYRLI